MIPKEEARLILDGVRLLLPPFTKTLAKKLAIKQIEAIIKFGNEMGIREPMMKYNKILEELKKL